MLLKLTTLAAIGYVGYKLYQQSRAANETARRRAVAGGPLSDEATLEHAGQPMGDWPAYQGAT